MLTQGILDQIASRAARNADFRQELVSDPRGVLKREYEIAVPEGVNINLIEDEHDTMTLALPPLITQHDPVANDTSTGTPGIAPHQVILLWTAICSSDGPCKLG